MLEPQGCLNSTPLSRQTKQAAQIWTIPSPRAGFIITNWAKSCEITNKHGRIEQNCRIWSWWVSGCWCHFSWKNCFSPGGVGWNQPLDLPVGAIGLVYKWTCLTGMGTFSSTKWRLQLTKDVSLRVCLVLHQLISTQIPKRFERCWWNRPVVSSCFIMFHHVSSCFIMFHHVSSCFIMFHRVSSCFIMFHHVSSCSLLKRMLAGLFCLVRGCATSLQVVESETGMREPCKSFCPLATSPPVRFRDCCLGIYVQVTGVPVVVVFCAQVQVEGIPKSHGLSPPIKNWANLF